MPALDPVLLAEILERPTEDASRLVLADALLEKSDPRGQLIVAQCRLEERGIPPDERAQLKRDVARLLVDHGKEWAGAAVGLGSYTMRRGFVDELSATAEKLAPVCAELFAMQPITRLEIDGASSDQIAHLARSGAFARVVRLTIRGSIGDAGAAALAIALAARKTPLVSLNVGANGITEAGAVLLAGALTGCQSIAFTSNELGDEGVTAIAKSKPLAGLRRLFLTDNGLTDEGLMSLAKSATFGSLLRLGVARNEEVTSEGLAAIAASKKLKQLRWLEYGDEDGYQAIAVRGR